MWTHREVAALLKAAQTANLLQQEEIAEPKPGIEALLIAGSVSSRTSSRSPGSNGWDRSQPVCANSLNGIGSPERRCPRAVLIHRRGLAHQP